jgi:hypothetical protein
VSEETDKARAALGATMVARIESDGARTQAGRQCTPRLRESVCSLFEKTMRINDRVGGFSSRQSIEQFHEARLVRITDGGFAICLDPFGMLEPEVVVNLSPELRVGVDLMSRDRWLGERFSGCAGPFVWPAFSVSALRSETNEFHKRLSSSG